MGARESTLGGQPKGRTAGAGGGNAQGSSCLARGTRNREPALVSISGSCLGHSVPFLLQYHGAKVFSAWEINLGDTELLDLFLLFQSSLQVILFQCSKGWKSTLKQLLINSCISKLHRTIIPQRCKHKMILHCVNYFPI